MLFGRTGFICNSEWFIISKIRRLQMEAHYLFAASNTICFMLAKEY